MFHAISPTCAVDNRHLPLTLPILTLLLLSGCVSAPRVAPPIVDLTLPRTNLMTADTALRANARVVRAWYHSQDRIRTLDVAWRVRKLHAAFDPTSPDVLRASAAGPYARGDVERGVAILNAWQAHKVDTPPLITFHVDQLIAAQRFDLARRVAFQGLDRHGSHPDLIAAADRAIDQDTTLIPPTPRPLIPDQHVTAIKALGGGSTVTLRVIKDDKTIGALKPHQDLEQSMYRSEIAYYRLCELLRCSFQVPYNEPVRLSRTDFFTLYDRIETDKQKGYRGKLSHMIWDVEIIDKTEQEVSYGTLKDWVPDFASFAIEYTDTWSYLLEPGTDTTILNTPATDWLPELTRAAGRVGRRNNKRLKRYMTGMTTGEVAHQLSDMLVMDFLANNWDRFSGNPDFSGANCHFQPGGFIAIDNGAAFPLWHAPRVVRRMRYAKRLSRSLVASIRRLDRAKTLARLFPNATGADSQRFARFWERRTEFLERVDQLIEKHGEDAVLYFP